MVSSATDGMTQIWKWWDANQFAGSIVAYKTDSYYFGAERGYKIESMLFGVVAQQDREVRGDDRVERGFQLEKLLTRNQIHTNTMLTNSELAEGIAMRVATVAELRLIRTAVERGDAVFDNRFTVEEGLALVGIFLEEQTK